MKKGKLIKRVLPLLCATLLLLGSCMTVCASNTDFSKVDISQYVGEYSYYCLFNSDKHNVAILFSSEPIVLYKDVAGNYAIPVGKCVYISYTNDNGVTWTDKCLMSYSFIYSDDLESGIYTNHDIYNTDGEIFFQQPPMPIAEMAIPLAGAVQNQTMIILPIAVGCLALLVGLAVLAKKLRIFL